MTAPPTFSLSLVPRPSSAEGDGALDPAYAAMPPVDDFEPALIFAPIASIPLLEDDRPRRAAG